MDSYHHIKKNTNYPAIFLTTGLNDSRVAAWQPAKFAARLQESTTSNKPVLLSVDFEGGHGFDASENKQDEELANILSFALWQTGHPGYQPKK
jgi:prolyl oligopeptidase